MKTVINIKSDVETKKQAQQLSKELGVPLSTIINVYLKQFIRTKEFTFSLARAMTPELEATIAQAEKDYKAGRNITGGFSDAESATKWLQKTAKRAD